MESTRLNGNYAAAAPAVSGLPPALAALGEYRQFIVWRSEPPRVASDGKTWSAARLRKAGYSDAQIEALPEGKGKPAKVPQNRHATSAGDPHSPDNWQSYAEAVALASERGAAYAVGFVLTAADPFVCIDVDDCREGTDWSALAMRIASMLPGAGCERSISGRGLHLWARYSGDAFPGRKNTKLNLEIYTRERFIALGDTATATGDAGTLYGPEIDAIRAQYFPETNGTGQGGRSAEWTTEPLGGDPIADDAALIAAARRSRPSVDAVLGDGATFEQLWSVDADALSRAFPPAEHRMDGGGFDASSADYSLAVRLAFWTGGDCERVLRLMEQSALRREKWERPDYLRATIAGAVATQAQSGRWYEGKQPATSTAPGPSADAQSDSEGKSGEGMADTLAGPGGEATELSVSRMIEAGYTGHHCYSPERKQWYVRGTGELWTPDAGDTAIRVLIRAHMDAMRTRGLQKGSNIGGILTHLRSGPLTYSGTWDADAELCGLPDNRVLDLSTGETRAATADDRISRKLGAVPVAGSPVRWLRFLSETVPEGEETAYTAWLQAWTGYTLTGHTRERKFVFLSGTGGNGKSVFLDTLKAALGEYAALMPKALLGGREAHPEWLTRCDGPRMAYLEEVEPGAKWRSSDLKNLTGGGSITARQMNKGSYDFRPSAKLVVAGNERPALKRVDPAIRDRLVFLEFNRRPAQPDLKLTEKLRGELGQIMSWAVAGAVRYLRDGLPALPDSAQRAALAYLANEDHFGRFLGDRFECDVRGFVTNTELRMEHQTWCVAEGITPWSVKAIRNELSNRKMDGLKLDHKRNGTRGVLGLSRKFPNPSGPVAGP